MSTDVTPAPSEAALAQARAHFIAGIGHVEAGRLPEAEQDFLAALALVPGRASVLANLGLVRLRAGRPADALAPLAEALAADAGDLASRTHQGLALAALGRHREADASLDLALQQAPNEAPLWRHKAQNLSQAGEGEAALAAVARALQLQPGDPDAWLLRADLLREADQADDAVAAYRQAQACGADAALVSHYLAALAPQGAQDPSLPAAPPRAYVETLFDQYAPEFNHHLVETLGYSGHERLLAQVAQRGARRYASALDLGCGTGLCGPLLQRLAARVDGVDVSAGMLAQARALGCYTQLAHADLADYLGAADRQDDLVVAADVFIYVGPLEPVFAGVARVLARGGVFAFTVEPLDDSDPAEVRLLPSLRYAHAPRYLRRLAAAHGFTIASLQRAPLREDQREAVPALYALLLRD